MRKVVIFIATASVLVVVTVILILVFLLRDTNEGPIVDTKVGKIQGLKSEDYGYSMYLGIPYAAVNESDPFGKYLPQAPFDGIYKAEDDSVVCPQRQIRDTVVRMTTDCLRLNVFVPDSANSNEKLPVMVWIHGGGFTMGSGGRRSFEPSYLVRHGVIVVSINYRLGLYGFMCLDIPEVPGNQGLRDQEAAFEWIQENIEAFGGDLSRITLFGESAGGMSIDYHLRTEKERFFNNVLLMSGVSLRGKILTRDSNPTAPMQIAQNLGFTTNNVYEALSYLATIEPHELIAASLAANLEFRPCAEQYFENADNFMSNYPVNVAPSRARNMPILLGYSNDEQLRSFANAPSASFLQKNEFLETLKILFDFDDEKLEEMEKIVREFYIAEEPITELVKRGIIDFDSDLNFNYPVERNIQALLENNVGDVYFYVFSYVGSRNILRIRNNITIGGATHSDILGYVFDSTELPSPDEDDQIVLDRITTMWTNFAKYSNPTPTTWDLMPITWTPLAKDTARYYLSLDLNVTMAQEPFNKRMAFWDLFYDINKVYERGYRDI